MKLENSLGEINNYLFALQQRNLVYNYNFLYFSNKNAQQYNHPDGWVYENSGSGSDITLDGNSCKITLANSSPSLIFQQALHEFPRWQSVLVNQPVSACAMLNVSKDSTVTVSLSDGVTSCSETYTAISQMDVTIDLKLPSVSQEAKGLTVKLQSESASAVISISKIFANIGEVAIEQLPCMVSGIIGERKQYISTQNSPAEELSLCESPVELSSDFTRLNSVLNQKFGKGSNNYSMLPDIRGLFSRCWNNGSSTDPNASGRKMLGNTSVKGDFAGTEEADDFKQHLHDLNFAPVSITVYPGSAATGLNLASTSKSANTGGDETRPKNFAELYTIKWA